MVELEGNMGSAVREIEQGGSEFYLSLGDLGDYLFPRERRAQYSPSGSRGFVRGESENCHIGQ
jgi:hypothetical protein